MKKTLLVLAAMTAFSGYAAAQSSVTLFGVVDLGLRSTKTGPSTIKSMTKNGISSSRLGFRGVEDIGGGMKAGFHIEGDIDPDTGGTSQTWTRRSTVSLMGGFGEVRLGRDFSPTFMNYTVFDAFGTNGVASALNVISVLGSGATTLVRTSNAVNYFLPAMGGVYGHLQVAAGEGTTGQKYMGARFGYAGGPVNVALALGKTHKTGTMIDDYTDTNVGVSYNAGFMRANFTYSKRDYATLNQKTIHGNLVFPVGAGNFKVGYAKSSGGTVAQDATQLGFGYDHNLSKRTALYATYGKQDRTGTATDVTAYEFGVRHNF